MGLNLVDMNYLVHDVLAQAMENNLNLGRF